jgi:hypothetical protein
MTYLPLPLSTPSTTDVWYPHLGLLQPFVMPLLLPTVTSPPCLPPPTPPPAAPPPPPMAADHASSPSDNLLPRSPDPSPAQAASWWRDGWRFEVEGVVVGGGGAEAEGDNAGMQGPDQRDKAGA